MLGNGVINLKKAKILRYSILGAVLGGTMLISYLHINGGSIYPSVHAVCPLGGLENLWAWFAGQGNIQKLFSGTMTLFFFMLIFALVFGRAFCGNICPFGFLQELLGKITKRKITVPKKLDKVLRLGKYLLLAVISLMAWTTATLWISPYDPWTAFSHIWSGGELFQENGAGFIILIVVVGASIFIDRFFCKYLCPAGGLYGIIAKISPTKIKREPCINCEKCANVCPMNVEIEKESTVKSAECILCGKCAEVCPEKGSKVGVFIFGKRISTLLFVLLTVAVFFGSILVLDAVGLMQVTVPTVASVQESGEFLKIADLRGSMTIEDGAFYTGMALDAFYELMEIPRSVPADTQLKAVSQYVPGYDFHAMKASK